MTPEQNDKIAASLSKLLADSYTLYLKTHNFHWNVTGPMFTTLHTLFETQYTELALAVDEIAERIRALGHRAPGSYEEFASMTKIKEASGSPNAETMIRDLMQDLDIVVQSAKAVCRVAEEFEDPPSVDLAVRRIQIAEKNRWMLGSHLES